MAAPSVTNTFSANTTALASEVNANFSDIIDGLSSGSTWDVVVSTLTATTVTGTLAGNISKAAAVTIASTGAGVNITTHSDSGDDFTVNTTALVVEGDTNRVGIGTASPGCELNIKGTSEILRLETPAAAASGSVYASFHDSAGQRGYVGYGSSSNDDMILINNRTAALAFGTSGGVKMTIDSSGYVYMPSLSSGAGTYALKWTTSTGQLTYDTSSARYKDNIRDSEYGLSSILSIQSRMFEYKDNGSTDIGFIAEEVVNHIPELVVIDKEGRPDAVHYDRFTSVLVKAVQELSSKVDALQAEIAALKAGV